MRLNVFARVLLASRVALLLGVVLGGILGLLYSLIQTPTYSATARVMVIADDGGGINDQLATTYLTEKRIENYRSLLTSVTLLDRAISVHGLPTTSPELARNLRLGSPKETALIDITVASPSPALAASYASAIAQEFVSASAQLEQPGEAIHSRLVGYADIPTRSDHPRTLHNVANSALVGFVVVAFFAMRRGVTNPHLSFLPDVRTIGGVPVIGSVWVDRRTYLSGQRSAIRQTGAARMGVAHLADRVIELDPGAADIQVACRDPRLGGLIADMLRRAINERALVGAPVPAVKASEGADHGDGLWLGVVPAATRWEEAVAFSRESRRAAGRQFLVIADEL